MQRYVPFRSFALEDSETEGCVDMIRTILTVGSSYFSQLPVKSLHWQPHDVEIGSAYA